MEPITLSLPKRRAKLNLLRNYYGLDSDEKKADPLDIDHKSFEPDKYFNKLLSGEHLNTLIQRNNELTTEIRQLDGDMETLVYENYSKFISATDTIRKMRNNVETMETEMDQLTKIMKVQFIFELPKRLNHCLEHQSYAQAARYYARTSKLFEHYRTLSVFNSIEIECKEIIQKVTMKMRENMMKSEATGIEIAESISLLIMLKEPGFQLQREYLEIGGKFLEQFLLKTVKEMSTLPLDYSIGVDADDELPLAQTLVKSNNRLNYLNNKFLTELNRFVESFYGFFLSGGKGQNKEVKSNTYKSPTRSPKTTEGTRIFHVNLKGEERSTAEKDFVVVVNALAKDYFEVVNTLLEFPDNITSLNPSIHLHILDELYWAILSRTSLCNIAGFQERVNQIIDNWENNLAKKVFGSLESQFLDRFAIFTQSKSGEETSSQMTAQNIQFFVLDNETWFTNYLSGECLALLEECVRTDAEIIRQRGGVAQLSQRFQTSFREFWDSIILSMLEYASANIQMTKMGSVDSILSIVPLVMARILYDFAEMIISQVYQAYSSRLCLRREPQTLGIDSYSFKDRTEIAKELMKDLKEVIFLCKESSQNLLRCYVEIAGNWISEKIRLNYPGFSSLQIIHPVEEVSDICKEILSNLTTINNDVVTLFGEPADSHKNQETKSIYQESIKGDLSRGASNLSLNSLTAPSYRRNQSSSPLNWLDNQRRHNFIITHIDQTQIEKFFSERVEIYGTVDFGKYGIMIGIMKIILKTFIEIIRLQTLSRTAFEKIQIDCEFLRLNLWKFFDDERLIVNLLQELATSAYRRCIDPITLDFALIEKIINPNA
ncbi:hypothetical protein G9A89_019844 [Geosiphon pyriformis]|nr:hypothetical protein G9A89_019844 [Geosiphon pyriformis]